MTKLHVVLVLAAAMAAPACDSDAERSDDALRAGPVVLMSDLAEVQGLAGYYDTDSDSMRFTQEAREVLGEMELTFVNDDGRQVGLSELAFDASSVFPEDEVLHVVDDGEVVASLVRESPQWFDGLTEEEAESNFPIVVVIECIEG
ncbi:MAG: hypothetical protein K0V04_33820 [Deltaproteobacteria bacterium]|nr:hypothetical protein [Deltaproteobacteria bacterium]